MLLSPLVEDAEPLPRTQLLRRTKLLFFFQFGASGALLTYFALFLANRGLGTLRIGIVFTVLMFATALGSFALTTVADMMGTHASFATGGIALGETARLSLVERETHVCSVLQESGSCARYRRSRASNGLVLRCASSRPRRCDKRCLFLSSAAFAFDNDKEKSMLTKRALFLAVLLGWLAPHLRRGRAACARRR